MAETTLRIERLDGGVLVIDAGPFATAVFEAPKVVAFEQIAGTTSRNAITNYDLELLNRFMGARTPYRRWKPIVDKRPRWLQRIDPQLDLIRTSERMWRAIDGDHLVHSALTG